VEQLAERAAWLAARSASATDPNGASVPREIHLLAPVVLEPLVALVPPSPIRSPFGIPLTLIRQI
jgi:hypothetical protein